MIKLCRAPLGMGVALILGLLLGAEARGAEAAAYSGMTSQKHRISFAVSGGYVRHLQYRIQDRCPGGKQLLIHASGFPALAIRRSRFGGRFVARAPAAATAIIQGTLSRQGVSGSISDRSQTRLSHRFCTGKATFRLARG